MIKKIYVLKRGEKSKIFYNWLDFFAEVQNLKEFESAKFCYDDELLAAGEEVRLSLKWALKCAEEFLQSDEDCQPLDEEQWAQEILEDAIEEIVDPEEEKLSDLLHEKLFIDEAIRFGSPWLDLLLDVVGGESPLISGRTFTGRYFAPSLYTALLYLILDTDRILEEQLARHEQVCDKKMSRLDRQNWYESIKYELYRSKEYLTLKEIFRKNQMQPLDLKEVKVRNVAAADGYHRKMLKIQLQSYAAMKRFVFQGNHTIVDLYHELVDNLIYQNELREVTGSYTNPDLELVQKTERMGSGLSMQQIMLQANDIRLKLKSEVVGQDAAIDKLEKSFFHTEKSAGELKKGPRNVFLFAGPPGVGKTFMAENFAHSLNIPYRRFDMSGYAANGSLEELEGISTFWSSSKPGVLTSYVLENPKCVLLFDEIEKAGASIIRLFLQVLDEGICFDRYYDCNISFKECVLIFTTNAGKQLFRNAGNENLTLLPDKVVIDALEKDINPETKSPYFPPELVSRMSSHTIIMFNHLKADGIRRVIKKDLQRQLLSTKQKYGFDISKGSEIVAATVQYSMGGGGDARNASKLAGKLIDRELYELLVLINEKAGQEKAGQPLKVSWECDFENTTEEIKEFYTGEKQCTILIFAKLAESTLGFLNESLSYSQTKVIATTEREEYMDIARRENVLFAVVDFALGIEEMEKSLDVSDADTKGRRVFWELKQDYEELPVYVLCNENRYVYSDREKQRLMSIGVEGFVEENNIVPDVNRIYYDICCKRAVEFLQLRHQVLTYKTRKEFELEKGTAKIIFYNLKLEMAVEAEDKSTLISDEIRPSKSWEDIYVSEDVKNELMFAIHYLQNPEEYKRKGVKEPKGVLMYGPPGTGKTSLAKVVAAESQVNFLAVSADELASGGADKVHELFRVARKYAPAVLFIDEIDAIGVNRKMRGADSTLNALLTEMDGFKRVVNKPIFIMAATNLGGAIDPALGRRFDRSFCVDLPKEKGRRWILDRLLAKHSNMFHISENEKQSLVDRSVGMSPAAIENVIETALREGIRSTRVVDDALLDEIFEKCHYGEQREVNSEKEVKHTAYHEAGHAVVQLYYGGTPDYMSVVARGKFNGYVLPGEVEGHPTKEMLLQIICSMLGGRACEMEFGYGLTPGASGDLKQATELATRMVCEFGMYEDEVGLAVISEDNLKYNEDAKRLINSILAEQLREARRILQEKKAAVERLVEAVLSSEQKYLTGKEIAAAYRGGEDCHEK